MTDDDKNDDEPVGLSAAAAAMAQLMGPELAHRARVMSGALADLLPDAFADVDERALFAMYLAGMKDGAEKAAHSGELMNEIAVALMAGALSDLSDDAGMGVEQLDAALKRQRDKHQGAGDEPQH